ncbi:hypothetical protein D7W79_23040 [Corallococcus exercitus]|uniref:Invertebrate defensins family profile domain-containing protein n=1 Tax=Corallococcus exercitus TaxID=2316736 RepID=A0A3A8I3T4_9BACT|nr:hypothetical protein [Corallococcus exercitus]NOK36860.1 hypothetical protein [Corallococcus exercitus]RKG74390.1 hypothetical protein D7W79_23040 [Corallococcus exercitus]
MIRFAKNVGQTLLAVVAATAVSFTATQAFSTPAPQGPQAYTCDACIQSCIEMGFSNGFCPSRNECACY